MSHRSGRLHSDRLWSRRGNWGRRRGGGLVIGWKTDAPKANDRFREFEFDVAADVAIVLRLHNLANHFFFCFFVCEEEQLARRNRRREANHRAVAEDEHGLGRFGERFALVAAIDSARSVHRHRNFKSDRLRSTSRFVWARGGRWSGDKRFVLFRDR